MDKRERIIVAASELLRERGIASTPTSLIAKQAGVSNGTLFRYFPTKPDVVYSVYESLADKIIATVLQSYSDDEDPRKRFFSYWSSVFDYFLRNPEETSLLLYLSTTPYIDGHFKVKVFDPLNDVLPGILGEVRDSGAPEGLNTTIYAWLIYGAMSFTSANISLLIPESISSPQDRETLIKKTIEMFWMGMHG